MAVEQANTAVLKIAVVSLFPAMFEAITAHGITGRACQQGLVDVACWNPRDFAQDKHRTVDDRPYGGGPGMLMMVQPLSDALNAARQWAGTAAQVIYLSPQGQVFNQQAATELGSGGNLILIAGRYEGIDERFIEAHVDQEWSIGDYVLSGGELPAMVMIDAITRLLPGALGHTQSAVEDSFSVGLLDCPHYTRPEVLDGKQVPAVLLSGDHKKILRWRHQQALGRTWLRRPDLLQGKDLTEEQQVLLTDYRRDLETTNSSCEATDSEEH
ncbi:MAG TPA: tRNA (guanosine(37)-N1)-methyltransferase TrmD [Cellvibrionaceae bacterium]